MGCDYYTWIEIVIEYTDPSGHPQTHVEKPDSDEYERNYDFGTSSYDPDFDDPPEDSLTADIRYYGKKHYMENGKWVCKEYGKQHIEELCEEHKIPFENITAVYKRKNGYRR